MMHVQSGTNKSARLIRSAHEDILHFAHDVHLYGLIFSVDND